ADAAALPPTVPEMDRRGAVRVARQDPGGGFDPASPGLDLDDVAALDPEAGRRRGTEVQGVVPGHLRQRLRQLLEPAVVGESAVVDRRVWAEVQLERRFAPARRRAGLTDCLGRPR